MAERRPRLLLAAAMLTWTVLMKLDVADAIWLTLPSSGTTKCVSEDIQNNVVVVADYHVVADDGNAAVPIPTVSARVTSPYGNNLHHLENVTSGQFAFTTKEAGVYLACFWLDAHHGEDAHHREDSGLSLSLDWKIGIAAKDWDTVAKKDKIEGVELELVKLEGIVQAIHENLNYLKDREAEMREVSEQTNARVAWFSIMSLGTCIVVSVIQLWRLQHYFQKKKLI